MRATLRAHGSCLLLLCAAVPSVSCRAFGGAPEPPVVLTQAEERVASEEFLRKAAEEPGAEEMASGLVIMRLRPGAGQSPGPADSITVEYRARRRDGTVIEGSRARGGPVTVSAASVIPCWSEVLPRLHVGGSATLACPARLVYGERGIPPQLPAGAAILFDIELVDVGRALSAGGH